MRVHKTFMSVAWIILMLHAFVPHAHGLNADNKISWSETTPDMSAYDYFIIALQFNPGPCHMDHFQNEDGQSIGLDNFDFITFSFIVTNLQVLLIDHSLPSDDDVSFLTRDFTGSFTHRGPPPII